MHSHKILRIASKQASLQDNLSKELKISKITSQVLINRGISSVAQAEEFLSANFSYLLDPFSFKGMHKAVERIHQAIKNKDKVLIFGDYDVDGVTSVALLKSTLRHLGLETLHYMPHRIKEGYGLTENILSTAKDQNVKLVITVDCGTSNHRQIAELKAHNIDTIVIDHHELHDENLPVALSIINPKLKACEYKYRDLAGVGVVYKLCQALSAKHLKEDLDLVTLGTIADVVPLTGENRIIVKEGLNLLSKTKRPGLRALIEGAGIKNKKFGTTVVSFILGPRLNASGRMSSAETSLNLLMSSSVSEAEEFASEIEKHNRVRQKTEAKIMQEAEDIINKEINFKDHKVIVVAKEDWHQGVLGIVASKLADRFYRPAIVISLSEELCKGSGRSIKNFHLFHALGECKELLHAFGGHAHAVGLTITRDSINDFRESINRLAHDKLSLEDLLPSLDVDMELSLSDLNERLISELENLEPFGAGNPEPLFYTRALALKGEPQSLARETLKFWVSDGKSSFQVIGFGMNNLRSSLMQAKSVDLVYTVRMDNWMDESSVILEARDIFFG
ncbi:MAG: single-stranded-DNA-specific exonuclease RecJ [Candidatus Omnitrophica bacterium]|nr:single-stranded-DNA-specific exonuclease RecJ [Candidatus Omnitrophota bacterium]